MPEPRSSTPIANEPSTLRHAAEHGRELAALPWADVLDQLARADGFWLVTLDRSGSPRPRPVFAVVADGAVHVSSSPAAQKAHNLDGDARCALGGHTNDFDLVIEGTSRRVTDAGALEQVVSAYRARYGWPVTVADDAMDAPFGAPTAGPPPYAVFRLEPTRAYAFGITDDTNILSTRYRF
jgi:Pyridoxamine 5'-phosphate oxidase